jgi:hypothetical protein
LEKRIKESSKTLTVVTISRVEKLKQLKKPPNNYTYNLSKVSLQYQVKPNKNGKLY